MAINTMKETPPEEKARVDALCKEMAKEWRRQVESIKRKDEGKFEGEV